MQYFLIFLCFLTLFSACESNDKCGKDCTSTEDCSKKTSCEQTCCSNDSSDENDASAAVFHCPMHLDYYSNRGGKCPKCGMELEEVK